ncbi:MAG: SPOR domain-containing protein [Burkholderiales bacterium]|nr:SPOR domain-containing protein [Burkholderiales bacterium]
MPARTPRDLRPRPAPASPRRKFAGGTLLGIVIGLLLGLVLAVGVAFYLNKGPKPFADKTGRNEKSAAKGASDASDPNRPLFGKDAKAAEKGRDGQEKEGKRFSFYEILPGKEEVVDPRKAAEAAKAEPRADAAKGEEARPAAKETYFLQAGAFASSGDADNQKAKLALMGFEARVETVDIEGKGTMHRVRLGPYNRLDDINRVRATLTQNGVDASLIRLKDPQKP